MSTLTTTNRHLAHGTTGTMMAAEVRLTARPSVRLLSSPRSHGMRCMVKQDIGKRGCKEPARDDGMLEERVAVPRAGSQTTLEGSSQARSTPHCGQTAASWKEWQGTYSTAQHLEASRHI